MPSLCSINMKHYILILSILTFTACKSKKPTEISNEVLSNSKKITIKLIDSLGFVTCSVPNKYDTFFQWTNWSDCGKPCAHEQYRFQLKNYPIAKESGWFWEDPKDSIDRFTILHTSYFPFNDITDTSNKVISMHAFPFKGRLSSNPINPPIIFDTIEKIKDRYFSIIIMDSINKINRIRNTKVAGLTTIKGNEIEFYYDYKTKDTSFKINEFIDNSLRLMRTIRLSNGT